MKFKNLALKFNPLIILLIFLSGCGIWGNFTTYFNLYYNTENLFSETQQSIQQQRTDLFAARYLPIGPKDNENLNTVIEKCSKILQFSPDSKYVDDAILMLGKSFFYQDNFLKASREFEELLATQKESDLRLEARLWLAKSQIKLRNFDTGLSTLKSVEEEAKNSDETEILEQALN